MHKTNIFSSGVLKILNNKFVKENILKFKNLFIGSGGLQKETRRWGGGCPRVLTTDPDLVYAPWRARSRKHARPAEGARRLHLSCFPQGLEPFLGVTSTLLGVARAPPWGSWYHRGEPDQRVRDEGCCTWAGWV